MKTFRMVSLISATALLLCVVTPVQASSVMRGEDTVAVSEHIDTDAFLAGTNVSVDAPVAGELFAVGTNVSANAVPGRSAWMAGQNVTVKGAAHDAFLAGSTVTISGTYGNDVYVAGSKVIIKEDTVINGDLRISGADTVLAGSVAGDVRLLGGTVTSSAKVGGSFVSDSVGTLTFTGGSVAKDLHYTSSTDASGMDKVTVGGSVQRTEPKSRISAAVSGAFLQILSGLLFVALFILIIPRRVRQTTQIMRTRWPLAFLLGVAVFFLVPLLALLFFVTLIGWQVGLLLIALYGVFVLSSFVFGAMLLGSLVLEFLQNRRGHTIPEQWSRRELWVAGLSGSFLVSLLIAVPGIGIIFGLVMLLVLFIPAMGATLLHEQQAS